MITLRLMTVTAALLFVLLQRVDVKVRLRDSLFIKINLNIIALVLYETKEKDKHLKDIFDAINKLPIFLKSIKYLLSKSNVILAFREETFLSDSPTIVTRIGSILSEQIIITYLIACSKHFRIERTPNYYEQSIRGKDCYDAFISFSFIHLVNSALILLFNTVKNKVEEVIKYV